jgi:hypothetical protein
MMSGSLTKKKRTQLRAHVNTGRPPILLFHSFHTTSDESAMTIENGSYIRRACRAGVCCVVRCFRSDPGARREMPHAHGSAHHHTTPLPFEKSRPWSLQPVIVLRTCAHSIGISAGPIDSPLANIARPSAERPAGAWTGRGSILRRRRRGRARCASASSARRSRRC